MMLEFNKAGDFAAFRDAEKWCTDRGVSVGSMERDSPIGLMVGDVSISKWRNLSESERLELHGTITGDKRNGPVYIQFDESKLNQVKL